MLMSRQRLLEGRTTLPHSHSLVPLLLMEAKKQVTGHSPISSQANVLETLFKIDIFFGSDVHGIGVGFHTVQSEKNHKVLILGKLYI